MAHNLQELLAPFKAICADPYAAGRGAAASGRKVAGFMCTYAPEELLYAAGYLPVRIFGFTESTQRGDGLLQSYACSLARAALDAALSGNLGFLNLMVFPHTCDTIQNLADVWKRNVPGMAHVTLATPTGVSGEHAARYYQSELNRVRNFLANDAPVTDASLAEAIAIYNRHRAAMQRLYALRCGAPGLITGHEMLLVALSAFFIDRKEHLALLDALLAGMEQSETGSSNRPKVLVIGAACQSVDYAAAIEQAGCVIVDDDLCTGSRAFAVPEVSCAEPMEALARMYMARRPCASKHDHTFHPGTSLAARAQLAGVNGVIFLFTKFCDPWAFDYPDGRDGLDAIGVPSLLVEIEQHQTPSAQFQTRVAAFIETLNVRATTV